MPAPDFSIDAERLDTLDDAALRRDIIDADQYLVRAVGVDRPPENRCELSPG